MNLGSAIIASPECRFTHFYLGEIEGGTLQNRFSNLTIAAACRRLQCLHQLRSPTQGTSCAGLFSLTLQSPLCFLWSARSQASPQSTCLRCFASTNPAFLGSLPPHRSCRELFPTLPQPMRVTLQPRWPPHKSGCSSCRTALRFQKRLGPRSNNSWIAAAISSYSAKGRSPAPLTVREIGGIATTASASSASS